MDRADVDRDDVDVVHTFCRICLSSCGLRVDVDRQANRVRRIAPDKENPYAWRDFCARGRTAHELVDHPHRIRRPMRRVGDTYVETSYEEAVGDIASRLNAIIDRHGPDAVASYFGNPAGFSFSNAIFFPGLLDAIGTQNRYWFGSLDTNNVHIVSEEMFGTPLVALTTDIDDCDCFLFIGTDPAVSGMNWIHNSPDGWKRVLGRQSTGADLIVVDPRRTDTAAAADIHVAVRPGQDWALLLALIAVILDRGWDRPSSLPERGRDAIRALVRDVDLQDLARRCDVDMVVIEDVARRFATARTSMCFAATGVSQTRHGTIGEWLVNVLNMICDRIDTPGGRRYERGVVDMVRMFDLIAPTSEHVSRLARRPTVAGFHTLGELPDEITTPGPGQVRALLMDAGNPVVSGPDGNNLDAALGELDLFVAFDVVQRTSHRHADWLLPGMHWLERDELHVLFAGLQEEPFIQYSRQAVAPPEGLKAEWEVIVDLCLAMKRDLFGKRGANAAIRASRTLARWTGRSRLAFNPRWIEHLLLLVGRRVSMRDVKRRPHGWRYAAKEYGTLERAIRTDDGRIHLDVPEFLDEVRSLVDQDPPETLDGLFVLGNRRHKDSMNSWLNELPGLHRRKRHNDLEIHPVDAEHLGLSDGDLACVSSATATITLPVVLTDAVRRGMVATHHGWGSDVLDPASGTATAGPGANRNLVVDGDHIDRFSQTSGLNDTYVRVSPAPASTEDDVASSILA